jgi:hypothetical protein
MSRKGQNGLQSRLGSWLVHHGIVRGMAVRGRENDSEIQQLGSAIDDRVGVSFFREISFRSVYKPASSWRAFLQNSAGKVFLVELTHAW